MQQAELLAPPKPLAAVERAKRLSMQFAPKGAHSSSPPSSLTESEGRTVGSPLSKRMATSSDHPEAADDTLMAGDGEVRHEIDIEVPADEDAMEMLL